MNLETFTGGVEIDPPISRYAEAEYARVEMGKMPQTMDERWVLVMDDRVLHIHRSWTGREIFRAHFSRTGKGWKVTKLLVVTEPDDWYRRTDRDGETLRVGALIETLALGGEYGQAQEAWNHHRRGSS